MPVFRVPVFPVNPYARVCGKRNNADAGTKRRDGLPHRGIGSGGTGGDHRRRYAGGLSCPDHRRVLSHCDGRRRPRRQGGGSRRDEPRDGNGRRPRRDGRRRGAHLYRGGQPLPDRRKPPRHALRCVYLFGGLAGLPLVHPRPHRGTGAGGPHRAGNRLFL